MVLAFSGWRLAVGIDAGEASLGPLHSMSFPNR
jgi:hypothetical protein